MFYAKFQKNNIASFVFHPHIESHQPRFYSDWHGWACALFSQVIGDWTANHRFPATLEGRTCRFHLVVFAQESE
jgi:hypothetical protein